MVFYKTKKLLPYDLAIMLFGIYPKELETYSHKTLHMNVHIGFIRNCKNLEATKMSYRAVRQ